MTSTSPLSQGGATSPWPAVPSTPVGYLSRKALPIKRSDAEPLTREDVQYDLLQYIFSNDKAVFTNPHGDEPPKVTFGTLYTSALYHSSKCSKVLKDKMTETPEFASELAKLSLLTNVGRINTTMAFFPEMKTALRTYHPVPSLQKTDGNAQDAPRIKNCLKAALLPSETKGVPPSTPEEVLAKRPLAAIHFDGNFNFLDLFVPGNSLASFERAQVFLWLAYHYLEDSDGPNPFSDKYSQIHAGKAPMIRRLTEEEQAQENVDTPEELHWGRTMSAKRNNFLQQLVSSVDSEKRGGGRSASSLFYFSDSGKWDAWVLATTTDPLDDSDDEGDTQNTLLDYTRRLNVLKRLDGWSPSEGATSDSITG
ncbi:hypothetical protein NMY22_g2570 [Coprinellus aureogranulatus]|nr:hypothetical protein NMY22_g2570 [Coprinellus aureogranulatus]